MVDTYAVATTLTLDDRLIIGLRRAADVAGDLDAILINLEKRLGGMGRRGVAGVTAAIDEMKISAASLSDTLRTLKLPSVSEIGLSSLNRSLGIAEGRAARLRESLAGLNTGGVPVGNSGHGGGRRGGRSGGGHGGGFTNGTQSGGSGRFHPTVGMNIPTGIGAAIGYGVYEEAQIEDLVSRVMLAANENVLGPNMMLNPDAKRIRDIVRNARSQTGMSAHQAGDALMPVILQMAGMPLAERLDLAPTFEKFAFVESKLKGVDPGEASSALIGLLHMTGSYTPAAINRMASATAFASTISPKGLPSIERMASYAMPSAMTAGIDPAQLLLVLANVQASGVGSTKAGTWFDALFRSLSPKGGLAAMISGRGGKQRLAALEKLGLVQNGKLVGLDMLEQGKWPEFSKMLATNLAKIPADQRLAVEAQATGSTQAARGLNILAQPGSTKNLPTLLNEQVSFLDGGLDAVIKKLSEGDPVVEFKKTLGDFTNALMDLGKVVLPPLTTALKGIDETLKKLIPHLPDAPKKSMKPKDLANIGALIGGTIGFAVAGPRGAAAGATVGAGTGYAVGGLQQSETMAIENGGTLDPDTGSFMPFPPRPRATGADSQAVADGTQRGILASTEGLGAAIGRDVAAALAHVTLRATIDQNPLATGKPPTDSSHIDGRLHPLHPATAF